MITSPELAREMQLKGAKVKATILSEKEKVFTQEFARTKNGTQSALKAYNTNDVNIAGSIASENLTKPKIRAEILRLLGDNDIELGEILGVHKRNMNQDKHFPTSQKAVSDFYEILGMKNQDAPKGETKIAFIITEA